MEKEFPGGWDGGIDKQTFFELMDQLGVRATEWGKICLFYSLDVDDTADERVQFETIVKLVTATKGGKYEKPATQTAAASKSASTAKGVSFDNMPNNALTKLLKDTTDGVKRRAIEWLDNFDAQQKVILDGLVFDVFDARVKAKALPEQAIGV